MSDVHDDYIDSLNEEAALDDARDDGRVSAIAEIVGRQPEYLHPRIMEMIYREMGYSRTDCEKIRRAFEAKQKRQRLRRPRP